MPEIWSGIDRYWPALIIDTACPDNKLYWIDKLVLDTTGSSSPFLIENNIFALLISRQYSLELNVMAKR